MRRWSTLAGALAVVIGLSCGAIAPPAPSPPAPSPLKHSPAAPSPLAGPSAAPGWDARAASRRLAERTNEWMADTPAAGQNFGCTMSCHTGLPLALVAGAHRIGFDVTGRFAESLARRVASARPWRAALPYYGTADSMTGRAAQSTEAILNALALLALDRGAGAAPRAVTLRAVEHMWTMQRGDGGFDWLDFDLEPWESGDEVIAASFACVAAAGAARTESVPRASPSVDELSRFMRKRAFATGASSFARAHALWAAAALPDLFSRAERVARTRELALLRGVDGGFSWAAAGVGTTTASDAMPTAAMLLAMCSLGSTLPREAPDVAEAARDAERWLASRQQLDGALPARSPNGDRARAHLFESDAATGYGALALEACSPSLAQRERGPGGEVSRLVSATAAGSPARRFPAR